MSLVTGKITPRNTKMKGGAYPKLMNGFGSATPIPMAEDPDQRIFSLKNPDPDFFAGSDLKIPR